MKIYEYEYILGMDVYLTTNGSELEEQKDFYKDRNMKMISKRCFKGVV